MTEIQRNVVIIGDGYVGKTSILEAIQGKCFKEKCPIICADFNENNRIYGKTVRLHYVDTTGQEVFSIRRQLSCKNADLFLLCFSVDDEILFENIETKWLLDLQAYKNVPVILIGTKCDMRQHTTCISRKRIVKFQKKIQALHYIECSAKTFQGIGHIRMVISNYFTEDHNNCIIQ